MSDLTYRQLATAARSVNDNVADERIKYENFLIMLITMGALVAFSNDGIGFLTGMAGAVLLAVQRFGPKLWYERFMEGVKTLKPSKARAHTESTLLPRSIDPLEQTSTDHIAKDIPRGAIS